MNWIKSRRSKKKKDGDTSQASNPKDIFPPELFEQIIMCIDSHEDLLNVALASKALCNLVIPHHIQLRNIHCEDTDQPLWITLVETPIFASYITTLTLGTGSVRYMWKDRVHPPVSSVSRFLGLAFCAWNAPNPLNDLAPALLQMTNLHTFSWWTAMGPNPIAITAALRALTKLHAMRSFDFGWCAYSKPADLNSILSPITQFRNLEEFKFRYRGWHPPEHLDILNSVAEMLIYRCPNLHILSIILSKSVTLPDNPWFFARANWPCLCNLTLKYHWDFHRPTDDLEGFVERHNASFKSLDWKIHGEGNRVIPIPSRHNTLNLHSLCVSHVQQISDVAHFSSVRALSLRMGSATLEDLVSSGIRMDGIQKVHLACGNHLTRVSNIADLNSWCKALPNIFPNISHLSALTVFHDNYLPYEAASRLTDALPRLLYVELVLHSGTSSLDGEPVEAGWERIVIQRNDRVSRTRRARPGEIVHHTKWGEM